MPHEAAVGVFVLGAYLLGAVPFGYLIGRAKGIDIRQHGSRNIGATNVGRAIGRKWGITCLTLDIAKGLVPTLVFGLTMMPAGQALAADWGAWLAVGVAAVLGHLFPVYLGFRGGKGVATTIGVALGIYPYFTVAMLCGVAGYFVARKLTGMVSVGSLTLAVVFPLALWIHVGLIERRALASYWPLLAVAVLLALLIIVRHRENIVRLIKGTEPSMTSSQ